MRLSLNKVLPLLLPFIKLVSATTLDTTHASSLQLVGSFSIGLEGGTAPLSFTKTLNLPLAPVAQSLLNWAQPSDTLQTQPAIAESAHVSESSSENGVLVVRGSDNEGVSELSDDAHERSELGDTDGVLPMCRDLQMQEGDTSLGQLLANVEEAQRLYGKETEVPEYDGTDIAGPMEGAEVVTKPDAEYKKTKKRDADSDDENSRQAIVKRTKLEDWNAKEEVHEEPLRRKHFTKKIRNTEGGGRIVGEGEAVFIVREGCETVQYIVSAAELGKFGGQSSE